MYSKVLHIMVNYRSLPFETTTILSLTAVTQCNQNMILKTSCVNLFSLIRRGYAYYCQLKLPVTFKR